MLLLLLGGAFLPSFGWRCFCPSPVGPCCLPSPLLDGAASPEKKAAPGQRCRSTKNKGSTGKHHCPRGGWSEGSTTQKGGRQKQHLPKREEAMLHHLTEERRNTAHKKGGEGSEHQPKGGGGITKSPALNLTSVHQSKQGNGRATQRRQRKAASSKQGGERSEAAVPLSRCGWICIPALPSFGWCCFVFSPFLGGAAPFILLLRSGWCFSPSYACEEKR